jgi:hypothetical protein
LSNPDRQVIPALFRHPQRFNPSVTCDYATAPVIERPFPLAGALEAVSGDRLDDLIDVVQFGIAVKKFGL